MTPHLAPVPSQSPRRFPHQVSTPPRLQTENETRTTHPPLSICARPVFTPKVPPAPLPPPAPPAPRNMTGVEVPPLAVVGRAVEEGTTVGSVDMAGGGGGEGGALRAFDDWISEVGYQRSTRASMMEWAWDVDGVFTAAYTHS